MCSHDRAMATAISFRMDELRLAHSNGEMRKRRRQNIIYFETAPPVTVAYFVPIYLFFLSHFQCIPTLLNACLPHFILCIFRKMCVWLCVYVCV